MLGGHATGSYLGKVAVARHAQKTDASQSVKAMLLTRTATANVAFPAFSFILRRHCTAFCNLRNSMPRPDAYIFDDYSGS